MQVALGFKAHSGWAAMVAVGASGKKLEVVERRRVELVAPAEAHWAKQPYHAAEGLPADEGADVVRRGVALARQLAEREVRAAVKALGGAGHEVVSCGVVLGSATPAWTVAEILAVHPRMHSAEGVLFRDVLVRAGEQCGLEVAGVRERDLWARGAKELRLAPTALQQLVASIGKTVGAPWTRDQKDAALVAWLALRRG